MIYILDSVTKNDNSLLACTHSFTISFFIQLAFCRVRNPFLRGFSICSILVGKNFDQLCI